MDVPKGLIGLASWMSTTPDGTPLLLRDLRTAEIYAADGEFAVDLCPGEKRRLTSPPAAANAFSGDSNPAFSPDGRKDPLTGD
jgi:hypothetical protein